MTDSIFSSMVLKDRYRIEERIGSGGMARVFKAHDSVLERPVAIKILHDHLADEPTFKERFVREAKFVASFNHPNIVQIYDFDVTDYGGGSLYYMVMPYIAGSTLKALLEEQVEKGEHLPQQRVLEIFRDVCDALSYAHAQGMIHRDVKPANILFDERGRAVLTDFGIARLVEGSSLTQEGVTTGTPAYMSPEQVEGAPVDARSDIYTMGVVLFEMLAGTVPYADESSVSTMLKHIQAPIPLLSDYRADSSPALDSVIVRALAKNPADRFATVDDLAHSLQAAMDSAPGTVWPLRQVHASPLTDDPASTQILTTGIISPTQTIAAIVRSSPRSILGLGVGAIIVLAVIALVTRSSPPANPPGDGGEVHSMTATTGGNLNSTFDSNAEDNHLWPQDRSSSVIREITADGFYHFRNERPDIAATTIVDAGDYYDAIITMQGQLQPESHADSAYGIIFRYMDRNNYYVFAVDGSRRYSIWALESGQWHELRQAEAAWTTSDAVNPVGERNELSVIVHGDHFIGSVNGTIVTDLTNDTIAAGQAGIYMATPRNDNAIADALIDSYVIETDDIGVPGMTAGH